MITLNKLTYIVLCIWPLLQLISLHSFGGDGLVVLDALMPSVFFLFVMTLMQISVLKKAFLTGTQLIPLLLFLTYIFFNSVIFGSATSLLQISRDQIKIVIIPLSIYFIIETLGNYLYQKSFVLSVIISGTIITGIGFSEFIAGHNLIGSLNAEAIRILTVYRTNGPFHDAIGYSTIVLLYIPFTYYAFKEKIIAKPMFILLLVFFSLGFLLTLSRATIIAYLVICLVLFCKNNVKSIFICTYLVVMATSLGYMALDYLSNSIVFSKRIADTAQISGRWQQYKECIDIFMENPLFGIGYGSYKSTHVYYIHNSYLRDLVELGIPGLLFHAFYFISVLFSKFKNWFFKYDYYVVKVRVSFVLIIAIVPNTIDLLNNHHFTLILFAMIAISNIGSISDAKCTELKNISVS